MVLARDTDYLLLDEPLNNLGMRHSAPMMRHLARVARELGRTVVAVLHDIAFAARHADRILAVKDGRVAAFGPTAEIMDAGLLTGVFDTEVRIIDGPDGPLAVSH